MAIKNKHLFPLQRRSVRTSARNSTVEHWKKVRKKAKIRNIYNQVPHLNQDTEWESDKNTRKHHIQESQEVSPFPAGDHKAERNRQDSMAKTNTINKNIHNRSTALERSVRKLLEGLNYFHGTNLTITDQPMLP